MPEYRKIIDLLYEPKGVHDPSKTYKIKDTVTSTDASKVYFALQDVPAGISIDNTNYWMLQIDLSASKAAMDAATANARTQTDATIASANIRVEDMMGKAADAVASVADYATKVDIRVKGETKITKDNPMTIYPDGGSLLKAQTDIPIKQLGSGDPYPAGGGKNLLNYDMWQYVGMQHGTAVFENNGVTITALEDDAYTNDALGWPDTDGYLAKIPVNPGESITLSWEADRSYSANIYIFPNADLSRLVVCNNNENRPLVYTATEGVSFATIRFTATKAGDVVSYRNIMVNKGTEAMPFEPYSNIRPFVGYDALGLNVAGKNLLNNIRYYDSTHTDIRAQYDNPLLLKAGVTYTLSTNFQADGLFFVDASGDGSLEAQYLLNYQYQVASLSYTPTRDIECIFVAIFNSGVPNGATIQLEIGSATSHEPYKGSIHTVQLGKTTYQGHYDWLTGKFRAEWAMDVLDGSEEWIDSAALGLKVIFTPDSEVPAIGVNAVAYMSHFKRSDTLVLQAMQLNEFTFANRNMSDSSTLSVRTDMSVDEFKAYLAAQKADGTPVQFMRRLATPIEIQLAPNVITAVEDGGVNYIYGDADLTVEWVKPLETSLTEHNNAKVDANNEALLMDIAQKERSVGNPVVINDAVANVAFPHVETVFPPKQAGSGDPYLAGGGRNLCSLGSKTLSYYEPLENESVIPAGTYTFSAVVSSNDTDSDECYVAFFDTYLGNTVGALWVKRSTGNDRVSGVVTLTADAKWIYLYASWNAAYGEGDTATFKDIQIEPGATASEYQPYSNIRPIIGYDRLNLGASGKNLFNVNGEITGSNPIVRIENDKIVIDSLADGNVSYVSYGAIYKRGKYTFSAKLTGEKATAIRIVTSVEHTGGRYNAFYDGWFSDISSGGRIVFETAADFGVSIVIVGDVGTAAEVYETMLAVGDVDSAYEPYRNTFHTLQLNETVYGGHYNWLTGKLTKNVGNITLDGSQGVVSNWFGEHGNIIVAYSVPDALTISPTVKSNLLISDKLKTEIGDDQHLFEQNTNSISMSGSSGCIVVCIRGITTLEGVHAWLSQNPVECVYPLATPIEIQLDPTRITTIPGTNTIFGDGEFTIDWFKSYKKVAEERENLLLDSFTDKAELSGNPIVMTPVGGIPFDSVVTEFAPKQAGSGDPYPVGGGKNQYNLAASTVIDVGTSHITNDGIAHTGTSSFAGVYIQYLKPNTQYTVSASSDVSLRIGATVKGVAEYELGFAIIGSSRGAFTFITPSDCTGLMLAFYYSAGGAFTVREIQIEPGATASEYQPYSNIRPITGYDKLELGVCGKNIFPAWAESSYTMNGVTFTKQADGSIRAQGTPTAYAYITLTDYKTLKEHGFTEGVHTISGLPEASNAWFVDLIGDANTQNINFYQNGSFNLSAEVKGNGTYAWRIVITPNMGAVDLIFKPQVEFGSAATPFVTYAGKPHTVQIGQTVYGGKFDWTTGKLLAEWAYRALTGNEEILRTSQYEFYRFDIYGVMPGIVSAVAENLNFVCSHYRVAHHPIGDNTVNCCISGYGDTGQVYIRDDAHASAEAYKTWLADQSAAGTPVQIVYKLATPVEIQLTSTEIRTLSGVNTLYGNGDTITAKFRQSKTISLEERLSALEAVFLNQ